jgi:hypothetical protein
VLAAARAASAAKAQQFRAHGAKPVRGGTAMDPVARNPGLRVRKQAQRKMISPGMIFLFGLMAFFGLYATGNLPQFDRLTDAAVKDTQSHNAQVVGTIVNDWRMIAYGGVGLCVLLIAFMIFNTVRARHNAEGEYDL